MSANPTLQNRGNVLQFFLLRACQMEKRKHHGYGLADEKAPPDAVNTDGITKDISQRQEDDDLPRSGNDQAGNAL